MIIHPKTFELLLRKKGLTQAALAQRARVGAKTVGRIKRGEELRGSNAEKIAAALGVRVDELQAPPTEDLEEKAGEKGGLQRLVTDMSGEARNALILTSLRYKVSEKAILESAPSLFAILAELSLKRRHQKNQAWKEAALASFQQGPRNDDPSVESMKDAILALFEEEERSIASRDLAGGFEGPHCDEDGRIGRGNAFFVYLEDLCEENDLNLSITSTNLEDGTPFSWPHMGTLFSMMGYELSSPIDDDEVGELMKCTIGISSGKVPLTEIPRDLLMSDDAAAKRRWVTSHPNFRTDSILSFSARLLDQYTALPSAPPNTTDGASDA